MAKKIARFGTRAEMALSSALWCTDAQRSALNKEASREAITSEWPRQFNFDGRCSAMRDYVRSLGLED
eukprot:14288534-Alexandrium_andersonii.AAC.1